jgi:predicted RNA-binding protein with EMAP domain
VPDAKPTLVERESLRQVHRLLDELRERGQDRDWLRTFVDYVHDMALRRSPEVRGGIEQMERGELEPA